MCYVINFTGEASVSHLNSGQYGKLSVHLLKHSLPVKDDTGISIRSK
jgi:hypothetical protein